jgi:hypothetical protein
MYVVRFGGPSPHALHFRRPHLLGRGAIPRAPHLFDRKSPTMAEDAAAAAAAATAAAAASRPLPVYSYRFRSRRRRPPTLFPSQARRRASRRTGRGGAARPEPGAAGEGGTLPGSPLPPDGRRQVRGRGRKPGRISAAATMSDHLVLALRLLLPSATTFSPLSRGAAAAAPGCGPARSARSTSIAAYES